MPVRIRYVIVFFFIVSTLSNTLISLSTSTCLIKVEKISKWDEIHNGNALYEEYGNKTAAMIAKEYGWLTPSSVAFSDKPAGGKKRELPLPFTFLDSDDEEGEEKEDEGKKKSSSAKIAKADHVLLAKNKMSLESEIRAMAADIVKTPTGESEAEEEEDDD